ncbi:glutaminase liver isoform, mitochondrial isoform X1 [Monodon monoceros]|uniref:glutaminase liver isoform, mitochondrial isoform X1 n=1 Tax=Monodon monoceros TaxID=40151 RepID=UPI0010F9A9A6|nr:glutaminase liver isoform, mitochondrial isoform X1 [Monodon monoceros]
MLSRLGDLLFYTIAEGQERIPIHKFTTALKATGLQTSDPRLRDCMSQMRRMVRETSSGGLLDRDLFRKCVSRNIVLLTQAFRKKFVIPDFEEFTSHVDRIFEDAKELTGGKVAAYIPQLAKSNPDLWGVSLCTVDGQRHSVGHTKIPFCLQSCVKPLTYAISISTLGTDYVHKFVGKEPSGLRYNKLSLNEEGIPHNPMVNAGAIVVSSLIKMDCNKAEKFDFVLQYLNKMAGNEYMGFSNATFQSEKETGDRNYAIGYYLKEKKCFPKGVDMMAALDLYFQKHQGNLLKDQDVKNIALHLRAQHSGPHRTLTSASSPQLCSVEVTCESGSVMAATLANGGICPITGESVLSAEAVRNTLSLMHSCGMYDLSGQFAFHVGLPAKSAVSGAILLVVPNIMGMMCLSPPLDKLGNSYRGVSFCQKLVSLFNFHNYDNLRHCARKLDPRREGGEVRNKTVVNLLFAAYSGDVSALRRFALSAMDMEQKDYDSRTALHVAAAEGHTEVVKFLIEACKVNPFVKDRWGNIPLDDAVQFNHLEVVKLLQGYQDSYTPSETQAEATAEALSKENLESMV